MNYLIAVTLKNTKGTLERTLYRVPMEATLVAVVTTATDRSELPGYTYCCGLEPLGIIEPHLYQNYVPLLDPRDVTDPVAT